MTVYSLDQVLRALAALRADAGLAPEQFPVEAFVGMISDEVETLRERGQTDEQIAQLIQASSGIDIDGATISKYYAPPAARQRHG